jgi:hypothetical protein
MPERRPLLIVDVAGYSCASCDGCERVVGDDCSQPRLVVDLQVWLVSCNLENVFVKLVTGNPGRAEIIEKQISLLSNSHMKTKQTQKRRGRFSYL